MIKNALFSNRLKVFYLRISPYYQKFLVSRYGNLTPNQDIPTVSFPVSSPYFDILIRYLVDNVKMRCVSNNSFCANAFNYRSQDVFARLDVAIPPAAQKSEFFAVVLPDRVYKAGMMYVTSGFWTLSSCGVVEFNRTVKREFWRACMTFIDDCFHLAHIEHRNMTRESAISDFMMVHDIPMDLYENIYRYEKRFRKEALKDIEQRRAELEKMNGVELFYT